MKNNLFNQALLKKYAKNKKFTLTVPKYDFLKKHAEKVQEGYFKSEVSSYLYFYDFLKEILGYDREENILFDEKEDSGRGKSEFALKSGDKKFMVIELKDQTTDLDKPQKRAGDRRTPVDQAFDYAQHSGDIDWIFVSNFREFRVYNWNKKSDKCICFTCDDLLDKDNFENFMLTFSRDSHLLKEYPEKLLKETLVVEKQLENNFYKLFQNPAYDNQRAGGVQHLSWDEAVHYAQLILNRYMFVSFAEDTLLTFKKLSKKLEKYYELELDDFIVEVRKKKVDVKARKNYQTLKNEFEESLAVVQPLLREIQDTDDEIDRMIYELYGLNEEDWD